MSPSTISDTKVVDAGNLLGLLLAGVAGVFGFLGLSGDEVTSVLRNEQEGPICGSSALVTLTALAGVVSIFTTQFLCRAFATFLVLVAGVLVPVTLLIIDLDGTTDSVNTVATAVAVMFGVGALLALVWTIGAAERTRKGTVGDVVPDGFVRGQPVLLVAAVFCSPPPSRPACASRSAARLRPLTCGSSPTSSAAVPRPISRSTSRRASSRPTRWSPWRSTASRAVRRTTTGSPAVPDRHRELRPRRRDVLTATTKGEVDDEVKLPMNDAHYEHLMLKAYPCTSNDAAAVTKLRCGSPNEEQSTYVDLHLIPRPAASATTSAAGTAPS